MTNKKKIYQCYRAYEESTRYHKDGNAVIFRSIYHYAELEYSSDSVLPKKSVDGNYYDVPDPQTAEIGNVYLEKVDFVFTNKTAEDIYQKQLSEMSVVDFEQLIIFLGFERQVYQVIYGKGTVVVDG